MCDYDSDDDMETRGNLYESEDTEEELLKLLLPQVGLGHKTTSGFF